MIKSAIMDFVQAKKWATRMEILEFLFNLKGKTYIPKLHRGYYSCAFCPTGDPDHIGHLIRPSKKEPRYLAKIAHGVYEVRDARKEIPPRKGFENL